MNGISSCANLTLTENLDVFDWYCDAGSGTATFFTKGLKEGKGLRNLIDSSGWKNNSVQVYLSAVAIKTNVPAMWWINTVTNLSTLDNSTTPVVMNLSASGTIYFIDANRATFGYEITADEVGLVTLGSFKLLKYAPSSITNFSTFDGTSVTPNTQAVLGGGTRKFIWIEANIDGFTGATPAANYGLLAYNWKFSRINKTTISPINQNATGFAMSLLNSHYNLVSGLDIYKVSSGFELSSSTYNIIRKLRVAEAKYNNINCKSISVSNASNYNKFSDVRVANQAPSSATSSKAISISASQNNVFQRLNIANVKGTLSAGIYLTGAFGGNIFSQVVTSANGNTGIDINASHSNIITHYTSVNNTSNGIYFSSATSSNNIFNSLAMANADKLIESVSFTAGTGNYLYNIAATDYINNASNTSGNVSALTFGGYLYAGPTNSCSNSGGSNLAFDCAAPGLTTISANISGDFVGKATSEVVNYYLIAKSSIGDTFDFLKWTSFEHFFRSWGIDNSDSFPSSNHKGYCDSS